jgi:hypothetical protein
MDCVGEIRGIFLKEEWLMNSCSTTVLGKMNMQIERRTRRKHPRNLLFGKARGIPSRPNIRRTCTPKLKRELNSKAS